MDTIFRIKKGREPSRLKHQDIVSGTLDSIHQNVVTNIRQHSLNIETLRDQVEQLKQQIRQIEDSNELPDILKCSKLKEDLHELTEKLDEIDPLKSYYLKNADIMLKYYGTAEKTQAAQTTAADQNTFLKYLNASQDAPNHSKKHLYEEYTCRMKMLTGQEGYDSKEVVSEHCHACNVAREENSEEGILICPNCGSEEYMMVVRIFPPSAIPQKSETIMRTRRSIT